MTKSNSTSNSEENEIVEIPLKQEYIKKGYLCPYHIADIDCIALDSSSMIKTMSCFDCKLFATPY